MQRLPALVLLLILIQGCHPEEQAFLLNEENHPNVTNAANILVVNNIPELQQIEISSKTSKNTVKVLGYHHPGDGGGGTFTWNASSVEQHDNGIVLSSKGEETGRWIRRLEGDINVKWFGAKGNGKIDDYSALNEAFKFGNRNSVNIYIPSGKYMILSGKSPGTGFELVEPSNFSIYGENGTRLITSLGEKEGFKLFYLLYGGENLEIRNISFENTHGLTQHRTTAIQNIQGGGTPLKNLTIKNCTFAGFSTAILPNGARQLMIEGCKFFAPKGRDSSQNNRAPAVHIWLHSNENGLTVDTTIKNCYAEGYSGKDIMSTATKEPFDGFLYGTGDGVMVENNKIRKMGYEAIFLQPHKDFVASADKRPVIIRNNNIHFEWIGIMKSHRTYGIRVDDSAVQIRDNIIKNATFGVLIYGFDYSYPLSDLKISNNSITTTADHGFNPRAIFVQGNNSGPVKNVLIEKNSIFLKGSALSNKSHLFFLADVDSAIISENDFEVNINKNGHRLELIGFHGKNTNFCLFANRGSGNYDKVYGDFSSLKNFLLGKTAAACSGSGNDLLEHQVQ